MTEAAGRQKNKELFQGAVIAKQGVSLDVWQGVRSSVCQENPQEGAAPRGQTVQRSMLGILRKLCYRLHCGTTVESPGAVGVSLRQEDLALSVLADQKGK